MSDTNKARDIAQALKHYAGTRSDGEAKTEVDAAALLLALAAAHDRTALTVKAMYEHLGGDNPLYVQEQPYTRDQWHCSGCGKTETAWYANGELEPNHNFAHNSDCVWVKVKAAIDAAMGADHE